MRKELSAEQFSELDLIVKKGAYTLCNRKKTHVEFLALAFLKYLLYTETTSWRTGGTNQFQNCPMSRGQRSKAISFLSKTKLVYSNQNRKRWFVSNKKKLIEALSRFEKTTN